MASIKKRPNGRWRARYRDSNNKEHASHFDTRAAAQQWLDAVTADLVRGTYVDPKAGKVTFGVFAEQWLASQTFDDSSREAVMSRLRVHLLPRFSGTELRAIRPSAIQAWLRGRQEKCAPTYVRVQLANLSAILGAAVDDGLIAKNPCASRSVRAPAVEQKLIIPWGHERTAAVIAAHPDRYRAMPIVAAGCGLRQGEIFGLRAEDVDFLRHKLSVRQQVKLVGGKPRTAPPKRGKTREIPLPESVALALAERLRAVPAGDDGLIFKSRENGLMNRSYYNTHIWKPALRVAGVAPTRENGMHALRHFYASVLLDAGENIRALADYLGHSDPGFTLRVYTHLMPNSEDRARRAVDAVLGPPADYSRTTGAEKN